MRKDHTLLYTDIVDSTAVNTRLGDAGMALLWDEHDRRSRELLRQWRGREIDRSDGFLVLFAQPADALAFSSHYHRMLGTLPVPLRARAGLHVGPLTLRENSAAEVALGAKPTEVVGIAKAMTARLMALALGGQTLASPSGHQALREDGALAGNWRSVSHGHWRLKGMDGVLEIFEVGDVHCAFMPPVDSDKSQRMVQMGGTGGMAGMAGTPIAWVGVRDVPHKLPAERDSFVGRSTELQQITGAYAEGARLLTITGPGGMGKTRLALRYAWSWLGDHPGGVWFCDLASARSIDGMTHAVGQSLDVPLGNDAVSQLGRAIAGRGRCLIILDNFEQLRLHARDTLGRWLDAAREARFLVTSREVLNLAGESMVALAPLAQPDAALLFHQRARAAHAAHDSEAEPDATQALVAMLDGMPLAIELAAPRVRVMATPELLARMSDRFRLLTAGSGRPDRQATLRATLAWSWELLSPDERAVLAQLAVFEGGFAWPAVQAVVSLGYGSDSGSDGDSDGNGNGTDNAPWIIDLLQSLVDKSLVSPQLGARFNLLRSVRDFAEEALGSAGSFTGAGPALRAQVQQRHFRHYAALSEEAALASRGAEVDNLVSACRAAVSQGAVDDGVACLRLAWAALQLTGPLRSVVSLAEEVVAMPGLSPVRQAEVDWVAGQAHGALGDNERALELAQRGLAALGAAGMPQIGYNDTAARLHCVIGTVMVSQGKLDEASLHLTTALARLPPQGDTNLRCTVMNGLGALAYHQGQPEKARKHYQQALQVAFAANDARWQGALLSNLGILQYASGQLDAARATYEQALSFARQGGDRRSEGNVRSNLGLLHLDQSRLAEAETELTQALHIARRLGHARLTYVATCNLGLVAKSNAQLDQAARLFEAAIAAARAAGDQPSVTEYTSYLNDIRPQAA